MILKNQFEKYFFGYGLAIFPFLLMIGPLISEVFLVLSIIFASYSIYKEENGTIIIRCSMNMTAAKMNQFFFEKGIVLNQLSEFSESLENQFLEIIKKS